MTVKQELDAMQSLYRLFDYQSESFQPHPDSDFSSILQDCRVLIRCAATLHRWAEKQCNGIPRYEPKAHMVLPSWTDKDQTDMERAQERAEAKAMAALARIFAAAPPVEFQRDPRGAMIKVYRPGDNTASGNPMWSF